MSCTSPWELEKKPGEGWTYDEDEMTFDSPLFDTLIPYYDSLGEVSVWAEEFEVADFEAAWNYEHRNGEGWLYDEPGITYDEDLYDGFRVYFDFLGLVTEWAFEERIEGCAPDYFFFMNGTQYEFQSAVPKEFQ